MLRNKPRLKYSGLTVVLSNPSRFDTASLLSAMGGHLFNDHCLRPEMNVMQCDVRLAEDTSPWMVDTKCILLLGEGALHRLVPEARNNSLGEVRGSVYQVSGIPAIASYFPQDAADIKAYEQTLNPNSKDYTIDDGGDDDDDDFDSVKRHGRTKRRNYAFWLRADTNKCKYILQHGVPCSEITPVYKTYPSSDEVIQILTMTKGQFLYFDMETDYEEQNLQCFSFSFGGRTVYNVPVLDFNYRPAYSCLSHILRALAIAIQDNTIVAHNGAAFDFFVLAHKYHIPINRAYDTMLAMHRCFPDIEKSLGHCTSYWTWERFHKDEDSKGYMTSEQMMARMKYCGKDVFTMYLIHQAIEKYAKTIPGLTHSIATVMDSIRPYLITSLLGIRYDEQKVVKIQQENDQLMMQYMRCIEILIGKQGLDDIHRCVKGKARSFPGSNAQCITYFHELLGYPVVARSQKTGKPSLGKKAMFKLRLKHENPVIDFTLGYRTIAKEYGTLKFVPWRNDNGQVINYKTYDTTSITIGNTSSNPTFGTQRIISRGDSDGEELPSELLGLRGM